MGESGSQAVLQVTCKGSPREVGQQHGRAAATQVRGSIDFYTEYFKEIAKVEWGAVGTEAERWLPYLQSQWQEYVEEMEGVADGAGVGLRDILALNIRTEIWNGLANPQGAADGCTSLAYHPKGHSPFLAQNWDWEARQAPNLIRLTIHQPRPRAVKIDMVTEAGIIGKIGLSSSGIGVCLNAIGAPGAVYDRLPVHLALRAALDADPRHLENGSAGQAERVAAMLERTGVASAATLMLADTDHAVGLETGCKDCVRVHPVQTERGVLVAHTNHYLQPHAVSDKQGQERWPHSFTRLERLEKLVRDSEKETRDVSHGLIDDWLRDEEGYPFSICRDRTEKSDVMSLFSIVMELQEKRAIVRMGRPRAGAEIFRLSAQQS